MPKGLTAQGVERLKPNPTKRIEVPDGILPGLYLVIQPSGVKSWAVRYRHAGRTRKLTLGRYPTLDLAAGRARARDALQAAAMGRDPAGEKRAAKERDGGANRDLVAVLIEQFLERHVRANNKPRTVEEVERYLRKEVAPRWGRRRVQDISRRDIIELLDGIVDRGAPIAANRTLAFVRRFFNWCEERSIVTASPCARLKPPSPETTRDRVLTDDELRVLWKATEQLGWPFGPFVRFLLLTGQRRDEVAGMRWSEIRDDGALWSIPGQRTKNGRPQDVPLSTEAKAVLAGLPRIAGEADFVFTTTGRTPISGYSHAKARLDELIDAAHRERIEKAGGDPDQASPAAGWTFHDLRRTLASGLARLGHPVHVVEAVLNHRSGTISGVAAVYNRYSYGEEKRRALEDWGKFVASLVGGAE